MQTKLLVSLGAALAVGGLIIGNSDFRLDTYRNLTCGAPFGGIPSTTDVTISAFCGQVRAQQLLAAQILLFVAAGILVAAFWIRRTATRPAPEGQPVFVTQPPNQPLGGPPVGWQPGNAVPPRPARSDPAKSPNLGRLAPNPLDTMIEVQVMKVGNTYYGLRGILEKYTTEGDAMVRFPGGVFPFDPDDLARVVD